MFDEVVVVRGGGDIASGTIQKLCRSGFKVLVLETAEPTSIRRSVCFSETVYEGKFLVEGIKAVLVNCFEEIKEAWDNERIPVVVDTEARFIEIVKPDIVVDAIMAKRNLGTNINMAPITIALGPGFEAGKDVNVVIETMRGHNLGRLIFNGMAIKNTSLPGEIEGFSKERVIYSPNDGIINIIKNIGDIVRSGDIIAYVEGMEVKATIDGVLRGIIRDKKQVCKGLKIADIDPRYAEQKNCFTISDKARNVGGAVLEAILILKNQSN